MRKAFASGAAASSGGAASAPGSGFSLFRETDQHELYPDPSSGDENPDHLAHFRFLGQILGKALYEGILVELPFAGFFLGKLRGRPNELNDLATLDPAIYRCAHEGLRAEMRARWWLCVCVTRGPMRRSTLHSRRRAPAATSGAPRAVKVRRRVAFEAALPPLL